MSTSTSNPILEALTASLNAGPAQKLSDDFYKLRSQSYWTHDGSSWVETSALRSSGSPQLAGSTTIDKQELRLISWNIDILVPFIEERMAAALIHLDEVVASTPAETPIVIFLQEMGQSDLAQIRAADWIKRRFHMTEFDHRNWLNALYGTTMLVDRRLRIEAVWRVPWISKFDRDGLFVDIALDRHDTATGPEKKVLRLCNTHLESLVADPPVRPLQLEAAGKYLHEDVVGAALLAGDLNAIQPFDRTLHSENGLKDAYLELGGKEDDDEGYTWGYQVPAYLKDKFGPSRMDKILFQGAVQAKSFERIGIDVKVAEEKRQEFREAGELEWVTDHYGVMGSFKMVGWRFEWDGGSVIESSERAKLA